LLKFPFLTHSSITRYLRNGWEPLQLIERSSAGKSGAFFYFSHDHKFVIKTMSKKENKTIRRILPLYHQVREMI
jgi:hypothetical protein